MGNHQSREREAIDDTLRKQREQLSQQANDLLQLQEQLNQREKRAGRERDAPRRT